LYPRNLCRIPASGTGTIASIGGDHTVSVSAIAVAIVGAIANTPLYFRANTAARAASW
jgi:hypothetical protein